MLHVRPEADPVGHVLPFVQVFPDGFLALLDEGLDAVFLNLLLAVDAQQLFHFQLHRQAVGVPSGDAQDGLALHGLVAGEEVLDGAGLHMADVGAAVGRGRSVVEGELLGRFVAQVEAALHDVVVLPELQHFFFTRRKVHVGADLIVHVVPPGIQNEKVGSRR